MTHKKAINDVKLVYINNENPFIACPYLVKRTPVAELIHMIQVLPKEKVLEKRKLFCLISIQMIFILTFSAAKSRRG
jgi:hypothetical protein